MRKYLLALGVLALAFLSIVPAHATAKFAVCATTCTWDNSSTAMWSLSSGGATGAAAPTSSDDVTLDANTCVGGTTCTITTFAGTISIASVTWGACTASTTGCIIAANTNNTNFTISSSGTTAFNGSGTGTRKWVAGTATYALTETSAFNNCFTMNTTTGDQGSVFSGATWSCSGNSGSGSSRGWLGGGFSFGPTTINSNSSGGSLTFTGNNTFSSLTLNAPNTIQFSNGQTQTITGALTVTGSSSSSIVDMISNGVDSTAAISIGSASTGTWIALRAIVFSGAGTFTGTNCMNAGLNTLNGGSCTLTAGGASGSNIIGGGL